jgi:hypothetical protein
MDQGLGEGCKTFDAALFDLVATKTISDAEALRAADSPNNLRIRLDRFRNHGGEAETTLRLVAPPPRQKSIPISQPSPIRPATGSPPSRN